MKKTAVLISILCTLACQKQPIEPQTVAGINADAVTAKDSVKFDSSIHFDVYINPGTKTSFFCSFSTSADTSFLKEAIFVFKQRSQQTTLTKARLFIDHDLIGVKLLSAETDTIRFAWRTAVPVLYTGFPHYMMVNIIGFGAKDSSFKFNLIAAPFLKKIKTIGLPQQGYKMIYK